MDTTYPAVLGRVLAQIRKDSGLDQAKAAEKCGINRSSWSRMENGEILPDAMQLKKITEAFGMTTDGFYKKVEIAEKALENKGLNVHHEKKKSSKVGWVLAGAALGGLIASALADKGKK